jgi:type I restriction enzyme S subunit
MSVMVPLKRIATFTAGGTPSVDHPDYWAYDGGGYPWIAISDMSSVDSVTTTARRISTDGLHAARIKLGKPGTILFSMYATLGHTAWLTSPAAWNQAILGLWPNSTTDARFLRYCLIALRPQLLEQVRSNTQANLNAEVVGNLRLPSPPIDVQWRIADFLDAETARIDHLIKAQESAVKVVSERRERVLEDIVIGGEGRESQIPLGYLTEYDRPIMYGIVLPGPNVEDGVPIVKGGDVAAGRLSLAQLNKTTHEIEASYKKSRLRAGDLVIAIRGSVGEVASVPAEIAGANLTQDAARIAPGSAVDARWLEFALQTPTIQEQIGSRITGATVKGINIWDLRRVLVPNISLDEQSEAVNKAEAALTRIDDFRSAARQQVSLLAERRQALITAAVTGGITA